ncbi:unnamed protein product [Protopolystoma xenopodis]|uniref:Uncharacterized protein n=1 Tax=Protopolystoma xenopodis TaxID=117903 RepID=A0A448XPG2_9PLAT|nr:unnamed protein product [Protopolystoma xenopodis]
MLSEQTVDDYLWRLKWILAKASNFGDGLLIRPPIPLTPRRPKLYWFIRNGHHSLDSRKPLPPTFFIAITFPPVSDRSLIQASPFHWSCSILVFPEFAKVASKLNI